MKKRWRTTQFCENCAKEFCCTQECKYHLLYRVKQARAKIGQLETDGSATINDALKILDRLIEESEKYYDIQVK